MMERLRDGVNGIAVKIILGLIICSFLFAGVGGYITAGNVEPVALVGGREISSNQFEQAYKNERQQLEAKVGDIVTTLLSSPNYLLQFRRSVLDKMVDQLLLDQYASELNVRVSDAQIKQAIRDIPAFSNSGIFNNDQYLSALRRAGLTPDQFAQYIRQDLERAYLVNALQGSEFVLKNELETRYKLEGQTRTVRTLTLPLADFTDSIVIKEDQKKAYYENNASQFLRPEQFKISYVELSAATLANLADITVAQAQAYYQDNLASYGTEERRKVSHIMIEGTDDMAKQKAEAVLVELQAGANFAELAKTRSDDTFSAKEGGQLDWFDSGVMSPAFEKAAFALVEKNDITDVVQSEFGFHIIQLDEISLPDITPFDDVRDAILTQLKQQEAVESFYQQSNALAEKAFETSDSLEDAAIAVGVNVKETDFLALASLEGVLANPEVIQALQQPEVRHDALNSELIEVGSEHVIVVRVNEVRPEMLLPFADVEAQVEDILLQIESEKAAETLVNTLMAQLNEGRVAALLSSGYAFGEEKVLARISPDTEEVKLAFTMPTPAKGMSKYAVTRAVNGDFILLSLDGVDEPELLETDLNEQLAERIMVNTINADMSSVLKQLKKSTEVTYSLDTIEP